MIRTVYEFVIIGIALRMCTNDFHTLPKYHQDPSLCNTTQSLYCACPGDYVISIQLARATELIYLFDRDDETRFYENEYGFYENGKTDK